MQVWNFWTELNSLFLQQNLVLFNINSTIISIYARALITAYVHDAKTRIIFDLVFLLDYLFMMNNSAIWQVANIDAVITPFLF